VGKKTLKAVSWPCIISQILYLSTGTLVKFLQGNVKQNNGHLCDDDRHVSSKVFQGHGHGHG
jgi:hypothetical protein